MSRRKYVEVTCDHCGQAAHFLPGLVDEQCRSTGMVISIYGDFCNQQCKSAFTSVRSAASLSLHAEPKE